MGVPLKVEVYEQGLFQRAGRHIDGAILKISNFLGPAVVGGAAGFIGAYDSSIKNNIDASTWLVWLATNPWVWLLGGVAISIFGIWGTDRFEKKQQTLIDELHEDQRNLENTKRRLDFAYEKTEAQGSRLREMQSELVKAALQSSFTVLGMNSNDRVSIYYELDDEFHLLSRYSSNPELSKPHRQKFPLNQGVISQAWQHHFHCDKECPHSGEQDRYESHMEAKYGYEAETVRAFTMKSCRYLGFSIMDAGSPVGVIIFESTHVGFLNGEFDAEVIKTHCEKYESLYSKHLRSGSSLNRELRAKAGRTADSIDEDILAQIRGGQNG